METRINQVGCILGRRGTGKTTYGRQIMDAYKKKHPHMKQIIFDTLDHPSYRDIPYIPPHLLARWKKPNTYRTWSSETDKMLLLASNLRNALIIFEDATKYVNKVIQKPLRSLIMDSKQKNLDIIFMFHGFSYMPPEMTRIVDYLTIFKCDNPAYRKSDIVGYETIAAAYDKVMQSKNPYAKETVCLQ